MIYLSYDPIDGTPIPDGVVDSYVDELIFQHDSASKYDNSFVLGIPDTSLDVCVGSMSVISEIRARISEGRISEKNVILIFEGNKYFISKRGVIEDAPSGLLDDGSVGRSVRILKNQVK